MNALFPLAQQAARHIERADALIITAGAGIGVDSGLPDFRGDAGFWRAYPALARARLSFTGIATPQAFVDSPATAWGFYGHRLARYRATTPHEGFRILQAIGDRLAHGAFVFTSNVDGQFQKAGVEAARIVECHGSIHHLQCLDACSDAIWPADALAPDVDDDACRWRGNLPTCPRCGATARPNILMFGDWNWLSARTDAQERRFADWSARTQNAVVIEIGAGTAIPSVRRFGERQRGPLIRINPREADVRRAGDVALPATGLAALTLLQQALRASGFL